ncbi:peptidoglycan DD-metalloendopeptidase family protein [Candidatus Kaiserbacteria bacterium]|nr:peptidoglycan DD-metalloendopeptidase family protein [Candidatus Kaiserbacteria bacterium]MCB9811425.1 peptidoglycan DD-metalloendopeptidase family protein [Candidatus Nomurabacteria bacterium]
MYRALFLASLVFITAVPVAEARSSYNSYSSKVERLDDDIVEDLPVPVLFGVDIDTVTPDFGDPRGDGTRTHEGQDLVAPQGTPIVSPTEAVVLRIGDGVSSGLYVRTANPGGEQFVYMHLDAINEELDEGDVLDVGDFIGTVGDTGNAKGIAYHLHFEIRDGEALDPYPRLTDTFTLKEKVSFLEGILDGVDDKDTYTELLVENFPADFKAALQAGYDLPDEFTEALEDAGVVTEAKLLETLNKLIDSIPTALPTGLTVGDQGTAVSLLQTYLLLRSDGPAHAQLQAAGATGYYGSITTAALREYQTENDLTETGVFDSATKADMLK